MDLNEKYFYIPDFIDNISFLTEQLFMQQTSSWQLAAANYKGLKKTLVRQLEIDGIRFAVQFNPERIRSSAAKTDAKSISKRKCFLCPQNLPTEQQGIPIYDNFLILVNPFPIFPKHLTITKLQHTNQLIAQNMETMLDISAVLSDYTVFYNGPKCGASAPDHLHFQAGNKGFLPVEKEFAGMKNRLQIMKYKSVEISFAANYLRRMITLQSNRKNDLLETFAKIYDILSALQPHESEPMLNIICYADKDSWTVHIFPRIKHRPSQFFEHGERQLLISPASVDFGGVFITPRIEDFEKITAEDIVDIFSQVVINKTDFEKIIYEINKIK
jgi:ATP adenylyltransferase/5',5'''-P-1,P-4-tetraphosphate phosphorylase II